MQNMAKESELIEQIVDRYDSDTGMLIPVILIVALVAVAGIAGWYYFTKMKKKPQLEKELEEEY